MAMAVIGNVSPVFQPVRHVSGFSPRLLLLRRFPAPAGFLRRGRLAVGAQAASSTAFVEAEPTANTVVVEKEGRGTGILGCPVCYEPLTLVSDVVLSVDSVGGAKLQCNCCKKSYSGKETHLELTASGGATKFGDGMPLSTEFFRSPFISFLYERGWRQNFFIGGFPGPEKEFELMKEYLTPVLGGNIVDASCGSGLFSRLFAKSGLFSLVVALDYSEAMLKQCYEFVKQEESISKENLVLVRADISRLPFVSCSVDAIHAGAAIHCWPSPSSATLALEGPVSGLKARLERKALARDEAFVAEICRVLKPGGVFVGTTYILDGPYRLLPLLGRLRQNVSQISGSHIFLGESELEDICTACGLVGFTCTRNRQFVMFSATKPI